MSVDTVQKTSNTAPLWKGSEKLIEQPGSPKFTNTGVEEKCVRVFMGPWAAVYAARTQVFPRLADMADFRIETVEAEHVTCRKGTLTITLSNTFTAGGGVEFDREDAEEPTYSIERKPLDKPIEMHPRYFGVVADSDLDLIDQVLGSKGAARAAIKALIVPARAKELLAYRVKGVDSYRVWQPVVNRKYFVKKSRRVPPNDPGAGIWQQPPFGPGGFFYYKTDGKLDFVFERLKLKGWWVIEEWTGFDVKDNVLYP